MFCSAFVSCSVRAPRVCCVLFHQSFHRFCFLSLSLSRASEVVAAFCLWSVWPTRGDSDSAPPGFESFGADNIRFSQTNNFATVIFFCFSSYTSSCTFLVMYVVKFCLLSFFLVMNMSEVRNQSSFCRVLVI